jgi:hypothetical protein
LIQIRRIFRNHLFTIDCKIITLGDDADRGLNTLN